MAKSTLMRKTHGERVFNVFNIILMLVLCTFFLYPVLNVLASSLSGSSAILKQKVTVFPIDFTTIGYNSVITNKYLWTSYGNTIFVSVISCVTGLLATCLAAYPLAYSKFYGKKIYTMMIMVALWFSGGMIPTYIVMHDLHLTNTLWSLVINTLCSSYYIIILRMFFESGIPMSLIESMKIDGANDFTILFRLVIPLSKAALATISLWIIVLHWNEFLAPLIYLQDRDKYTLQIILRDIILQASGSLSGISDQTKVGAEGQMVIPTQVQDAVIVVSMLPMIIIYPFLQKYFVKGIMIGAVKG